MSLSLSNSLSFGQIPIVKIGKIAKKSYFSDFNPIFCYLGVLSQNMHFLKCVQTLFLTSTLSCDDIPFLKIYGKSIILLIFFYVFTPSLKVWQIFVENSWRNYLSKFTTFHPVFTTYALCNAMYLLLLEEELATSPYWSSLK